MEIKEAGNTTVVKVNVRISDEKEIAVFAVQISRIKNSNYGTPRFQLAVFRVDSFLNSVPSLSGCFSKLFKTSGWFSDEKEIAVLAVGYYLNLYEIQFEII